jgi:hypothetical protein
MAKPTDHDLGSEPIELRHHDQMNAIARSLDDLFNGDVKGNARDTGFVLLVFPYGEREGRANYISNGANRGDVIRLLEEQINRFRAEGHGDDDTPIIAAMADSIGRMLDMNRTGHMLSREALLSAAQAAMLTYRKGPP